MTESFNVVYLTQHKHYMPIYLKKEGPVCKILLTDSLGKGTNYIRDIFKTITFSSDHELIIYNYQVERQFDMGSCGIFSLYDMVTLSKMTDNSIFDFVSNFTTNSIRLKSACRVIKINNFDALPPPLITTAQSITLLNLNTEKCREKGCLTKKDLVHLEKKKAKHLCYNEGHKEINQTVVDKATKCHLMVLTNWLEKTKDVIRPVE